MAVNHGHGRLGLPVDHAKCMELLRQSADLGFRNAQYNLGIFYEAGEMGLEQNEAEAVKNWMEAAEGGHVLSRNSLGCDEYKNGDNAAAMRHWRLAASSGHRESIGALIECFEDGLLHHADLAETLQSMYVARAEMRSKDRDMYIAHLKSTGAYNEEYEY